MKEDYSHAAMLQNSFDFNFEKIVKISKINKNKINQNSDFFLQIKR